MFYAMNSLTFASKFYPEPCRCFHLELAPLLTEDKRIPLDYLLDDQSECTFILLLVLTKLFLLSIVPDRVCHSLGCVAFHWLYPELIFKSLRIRRSLKIPYFNEIILSNDPSNSEWNVKCSKLFQHMKTYLKTL